MEQRATQNVIRCKENRINMKREQACKLDKKCEKDKQAEKHTQTV